MNSQEQPVCHSQPGAPDTVRCTTGQSGAPRLSRLWLNKAISFSIQFFLFPALRHNTLVQKQCTKSRNIPFDMICILSTTLHRLAQKHLCWHSITKILRNGPRAHFPFNSTRVLLSSWVMSVPGRGVVVVVPRPSRVVPPVEAVADSVLVAWLRVGMP
jgi:hypothetical protein